MKPGCVKRPFDFFQPGQKGKDGCQRALKKKQEVISLLAGF